MTIARGRPWGEHGPLPPEGVIVRTDAEARAVVETARRADRTPPPIGLLGGDLCRTLGGQGREERLRSDEAIRVPVDLASVLVDGRQFWFVAHLVAVRSWWWGRAVVAMNAAFLGRWNLAPRAHPGDGRLDVLDGDLPLGERLKARSRLPAGLHVPHPAIREQRVRALQIELDRPTPVHLDGVPVGTARFLALRVEPDAVTFVV